MSKATKYYSVIVDNISKSFNGSQVLRDISTTINVGEVLGLIGRSESGKSVLIHALRGTEEYRPTSGKIIYRVNHCKKCNRAYLPAPGKPCTRCGEPTQIEEVDFWGLDQEDTSPDGRQRTHCHHAPAIIRVIR